MDLLQNAINYEKCGSWAGVDRSGWSVSMNHDGDRVAIGAYLNDGNGSNARNTHLMVKA